MLFDAMMNVSDNNGIGSINKLCEFSEFFFLSQVSDAFNQRFIIL